MSKGFALLWSKILESSLWVKGSKETRLVWIACLAMKDAEGRIQSSLVGLADRAKVTDDECKASLAVLLAPDADDTSHVDDGRRLREIPGGWLVVNHDHYRFSSEERRQFWRQQKAQQRAKKKGKKKTQEPPKESLSWSKGTVTEKAFCEGDEKAKDEILDSLNQ